MPRQPLRGYLTASFEERRLPVPRGRFWPSACDWRLDRSANRASILAAAIRVHDDLPLAASHMSFVVTGRRIGQAQNRVKGDFCPGNLWASGQVFPLIAPNEHSGVDLTTPVRQIRANFRHRFVGAKRFDNDGQRFGVNLWKRRFALDLDRECKAFDQR